MNSRIAIATADGVSVSPHLARSSAFIVLEIESGSVVSQTVRSRESDQCGNHKSFVEMLEGCAAVICGGIGHGAYDSLQAAGIKSVVAAGEFTIDDAAARYLAGTLPESGERICLCH